MKKFLKEKLVPFVNRSLAVLGIAWLALFVLGNVGSCFVRKANAAVLPSERYVDFYIPSVEFLIEIPPYSGAPIQSASTFGGITLRFDTLDLAGGDLYPEFYSFDNSQYYDFEGYIELPSYGIINGVPGFDFTQLLSVNFDFSELNGMRLSEIQSYTVYYSDRAIEVSFKTVIPYGSILRITHQSPNAYIPDYLLDTSVNFIPSSVYYDRGYDRGYMEGKSAGIEQGFLNGREQGFNDGFEAGAGDPFLDLMNAIVFVPINFIFNLLSFDLFGVNLFGVFTLIITLLVVWWIFSKIKGD